MHPPRGQACQVRPHRSSRQPAYSVCLTCDDPPAPRTPPTPPMLPWSAMRSLAGAPATALKLYCTTCNIQERRPPPQQKPLSDYRIALRPFWD
eukprot:COSAG01_NODE_3012_length_6723_cov_13.578351_4_plen_93_part_00